MLIHDFEQRIEDLFKWTLDKTAVTLMTITVGDYDPNQIEKNAYIQC